MEPLTLPQELIDKIIDQFSKTAGSNENSVLNKRALASLSMVARAWRERSQKRLFSVIDFRNLSSTDIAEADLDEFGPMYSLTRDLNIDGYWEVLFQFDPVAKASLRCFRNLESLSLSGWYFKFLSADQLSASFSHLGETLTQLKLGGVASSESLIHLTLMFPRLRVLEISISGVIRQETRRIPVDQLPTTRCFQGYLHLCGLSEAHDAFLAFISSTSPRFESICIDDCETGNEMWELLNSSAASLESLQLYIHKDDLRAEMTSLSEFAQLREVSISHPYPESTPELLRTLHSPHLKKFAVRFSLWPYGGSVREEDGDTWRKVDGELCAAYDQWVKHAMGRIEVTFCVPGTDLSGYWLEGYRGDLKRFFPRFTEKAAVTIIC